MNVGVAAHITAASPGGPRFDPSLDGTARKAAENGIWLCQTCAKLIDSDIERFPASLLLEWKNRAEACARAEVESRGADRNRPRLRPSAKGPGSASTRFLREVLDRTARRPILGGLEDCPGRLHDVLVEVRQVAGPPGSPGAVVERRVIAELQDVRTGAGAAPPTVLVLGDVGSGKTELAASLASQLAEAALGDESRPLPLLVGARALHRTTWRRAMELEWPGLERTIVTLRAHPGGWVLIVDGFDEVGAKLENDLDGLRRRFNMRALVVTSRPTMRPRLVGAVEVWLAPWTDTDVEILQERWATFDPQAVRQLRTAPGGDGFRCLLRSPLTATMALLVASSQPSAVRNRAALFGAVTDRLFHDWARQRTASDEPRWAEVAASLRRIAIEYLRTGEPVEAAEVRSILRRHHDAGGREVELTLGRTLGVLVPRGESYDFAIRGIAEHLAGRALANGSDEALAEAANTVWAAEPVRHAIGLLAMDAPERVPGALAEILRGSEADHPGFRNAHLRGVLAAVRAAADAGLSAGPVRERLASAISMRLFDEQSTWVGDVVAEAVRELASAGGPCWSSLEQEVIERICGPVLPAAWYAAQDWASPSQWLELRYHRDPAVRVVAASRLTRWVNEPPVRDALVHMLADGHAIPFRQPPAVAAALALRAASRDAQFATVIDGLAKTVATRREQLAIAVVAAALEPHELPPTLHAVVVEELRNAGVVYGVPDPVLAAWGLASAGVSSAATLAQPSEPGRVPPSSIEVRTRLARAAAPSFPRLGHAVRGRLLAAAGPAASEALCELGVEHPDVLLQLLTPEGRPIAPWSGRAQAWIGLAAARHRDVRDQLLRLWSECRGNGAARPYAYPALALEPLIRRGDEEAAAIYAEWLPGCIQLKGLSADSLVAPAAEVIAREPIRTAAARVAADVFEYAVHGRDDEEGRRTWLVPTVAGPVLAILAPVWCDVHEYRSELIGWTAPAPVESQASTEMVLWRNADRLVGALYALEHAHLRSEERRVIARGFLPTFSAGMIGSGFVFTRATLLLRLAGRCELVPYLRDLLRLLAEPGTVLTPHAAALLVPYLAPDEAHSMAVAVAPKAWGAIAPGAISPEALRGLVSAAPVAWSESLRAGLTAERVEFSTAIVYLEALPAPHREAVARHWMEHVRDAELPWMMEQFEGGAAWRAADRVRGILFELGVEVPS